MPSASTTRGQRRSASQITSGATPTLITPNVSIIGYPNAFSHFDQTPRAQMSDLVALTRVLVVVALLAQDADWRAAYL